MTVNIQRMHLPKGRSIILYCYIVRRRLTSCNQPQEFPDRTYILLYARIASEQSGGTKDALLQYKQKQRP